MSLNRQPMIKRIVRVYDRIDKQEKIWFNGRRIYQGNPLNFGDVLQTLGFSVTTYAVDDLDNEQKYPDILDEFSETMWSYIG